MALLAQPMVVLAVLAVTAPAEELAALRQL
jgi:hypothetical protein